jgi:hypothetical protein
MRQRVRLEEADNGAMLDGRGRVRVAVAVLHPATRRLKLTVEHRAGDLLVAR